MGEMKDHCRDPVVGAYFSSLGVEVDQVEKIFQLLDKHNSGRIDVHELKYGCLRLKGFARSLDLALVMKDVGRTRRMAESLLVRSFAPSCTDSVNDSKALTGNQSETFCM